MAAYLESLAFVSLSFLVGVLSISGMLITAAAFKFLVCCDSKRK